MKTYLDSEEEFQNALVIPASQIRKFLSDYLNFIKSGSNKLEVITKELKEEIKTTESAIPTTPTSSTVVSPTTQTTLPTSSNQIPEKEYPPINPIPNFLKLMLAYSGLGLFASVIGRYYYIKNPPKPNEDKKDGNISLRLSELEKYFEEHEARKKLQTKFPKTIRNTNNQKTIVGFQEKPLNAVDDFLINGTQMPEPMFVRWLENLTPRELPKTYKEHVEREIKLRKEHAEKETMNLIKTRLDRQKTTIRLIKKDYQIFEEEAAKFEKERAELIAKLDSERAERLKKLFF